jgi:hypothetical protein
MGPRSTKVMRSGTSRSGWVLDTHGIVRAARYPNCSTIAKEIEATPKTIQGDINIMRD